MRRIADLPTLADLQARPRASPKPTRPKAPAKGRKPKGPTARRTAARARAERPVKDRVRARCVERDHECRAQGRPGDVDGIRHCCAGPSEWAHWRSRTRAKTRGMAAEARHATAWSLMLCKLMHDRYDGRSSAYRLVVEALTDLGADGPLKFTLEDR